MYGYEELASYTSGEIRFNDSLLGLRFYETKNTDKVILAHEDRIKELEAAIAIFETTQKWISVEDRLPDENKKVLVTNPSAHTSKIAWKYRGHWFFDTNFDVLEPTHWMPLPSTPTTEEI